MWYLNKITNLKWDVNDKNKDLIRRLNEDIKTYEKIEETKKIVTAKVGGK